MSDNNEERLYSQKEVLSIASKMLGKSPKDLATLAEGKDLSDVDTLSTFLKVQNAERLNSEFDKGSKKAAIKSEKLIKEIFSNEDFSDMEREQMLIHLRDNTPYSTKPEPKDKTNKITYDQALSVPEVKAAFDSLKAKADLVDTKAKELETYKSTEYLTRFAIKALEKQGAQFSKDPVVRERQIRALKTEISGKSYKKADDGTPIFLDEDGETPLRNRDAAEPWVFDEYIKQFSPVDFGEVVIKKEDKEPYTPDSRNQGSGPNFGYSQSELKKLDNSHYKAAKSEGNTAKMDFIKTQMYKNIESK